MEKKPGQIRKVVREGYTKVAKSASSCGCGDKKFSCCGSAQDYAKNISKIVGYSDEEMTSVPDGANLGLGCGNPVAIAGLKEGEVVLDLGSGAGFDAFLASKKVGKTGKVIGVDMTPEMIAKAKKNAEKSNFTNVEFKLGEIEKLPIEDNTIDIIISNCVINLSPEKQKVFNEAYRVLKPGGRIMVSDLVLTKELPDAVKDSVEAYVGCLSGALMKDTYLGYIKMAGFKDIKINGETNYPVVAMANDATVKTALKDTGLSSTYAKDIESSVLSIKIRAFKPAGDNA